jgi:citrate lyase subunit beta/citryl-CoA lyase
MRLLRSHLFAPGDQARLLEKVFTAGADAVVLDLEDAVAADRKVVARELVAAALATRGDGGPAVAVRINSVDSGLWADDLDAIVQPHLDIVRVAKVDSRAELEQVAARIDALEAARGLPAGIIQVVPTIESAAGVFHAAAIAGAPRVRGFAFGATDYLRDLGAPREAGDPETLFARAQLVLVSRVFGLQPPIASVHTRIDDLEGLRCTSEAARLLGFFGRSCIHPRQVPVVHEVFSPSEAEVAEARAVVAAFAEAQAQSRASIALPGGQFVDRAVQRRASAVLALADALAAPATVERSR